jgi:hypothetical protein
MSETFVGDLKRRLSEVMAERRAEERAVLEADRLRVRLRAEARARRRELERDPEIARHVRELADHMRVPVGTVLDGLALSEAPLRVVEAEIRAANKPPTSTPEPTNRRTRPSPVDTEINPYAGPSYQRRVR